MIYYILLFGCVAIPLRANSVIASASVSPETSRVIEKAVRTVSVTCAAESRGATLCMMF